MVRIGETLLAVRGVVLSDLADDKGIVCYRCGCGQTYRGLVGDESFCDLVYLHVENCDFATGGMAHYPIEMCLEGGVCPECEEHRGDRGGRCHNVFVDDGGRAVSRCKCFGDVHRKKYLGDSTLRRR